MIPVFYRPEMAADSASYSPSAAKPKIVMDHWLQHGTIKPEQVHTFEPASRADFGLAHDLEFIDAILSRQRQNGFGNYSQAVADSLPYTTGTIKPEQVHTFEPASRADFGLAHDLEFVDAILSRQCENGFGNYSQAVADSLPYTTGSMIAATQHVIQHGGFACSPTSGFHHAGYDHAAGFCTFNGLAVAAIMGAMQGAKVGILDFDAHYGDGTDHILRIVPELGIKHHTFGRHYPCGKRANGWKTWLLKALADLSRCDVVLYQAGADPYILDPLGGQLNMMELEYRDHLVFEMLDNVAWNLAGGYTRDHNGDIPDVVTIHTRTIKAAQNSAKHKESQ